jgi:hypothetical protein
VAALPRAINSFNRASSANISAEYHPAPHQRHRWKLSQQLGILPQMLGRMFGSHHSAREVKEHRVRPVIPAPRQLPLKWV